MFDWDRFKNGEFVVTFGKEEDAKDFLKECDKRDIKWRDGTKATDFENFWNGNSNLYFEFSKLPNGICYGRTNLRAIEERMIVKWEVKEMKELTFKEVIANIKEGEVWENESQRVAKIYINKSGNVQLEGIDNGFSQNYSTCVGLNAKYKLQRKEYTFEEAFKAYEEGKEIESESWRYKKINGKDSICSKDNDAWVTSKLAAIDIKEIRGKWYIND